MPTFWPPVRIGGLPMALSLWCGVGGAVGGE